MSRFGWELMTRKCDQCLLSPDKIVSNARRKEILTDTARKDCSFVCHKTPEGREIACRGHYDATGGGQMARIAQRLGCIIEVDPVTLERLP